MVALTLYCGTRSAARTEREVRDVRRTADPAGEPAGGGRALRRGPLHGGRGVPYRQAGRAGCSSAVPGRPGRSGEQVELEEARAEIERLGATVTEQAVTLHLHQGKSRWTDRRPCPPRVDAPVKQGVVELVRYAHEHGGWFAAPLGLGARHRAHPAAALGGPRARRSAGRCQARPGDAGACAAGLGREAILELAEQWGETDRSHRKLAHRGSRLQVVHASESMVWRVLVAAGVILPDASRVPRRHGRPGPSSSPG
jgi:hypothetical protein